MVILGAHVSTAGSLITAVKEAKKLQVKVIQVFSSSPRTWVGPIRPPAELDQFKQALARANISPVFIHAKYLVNLGSPDEAMAAKSVQSLRYDLHFCAQIGAAGVIVHVGSYKNSCKDASLKAIIRRCQQILANTPSVARLVLENSAGAGQTIGSDLRDIAYLAKKIRSKRICFCYDTCHGFASGYDIRTKKAVSRTIDTIDHQIGLSKLVCLHLNDSRTPLASNRDRHANIGEGYIGRLGFQEFINHPRLSGLPFIIETPNLKINQGKKDLDLLRSLIRNKH